MTGSNRLAGETSPYLQQHRGNPVHWWPWGTEALDNARANDKPILLSVGYAACHWCHVMAHECFEDDEVASVMNTLFVNIKVDREERPDIDQIYMAALNATGEQGGWPLTMFLTPDAQPFWGGTYFPKQPRYGRPGFIQVMQSVHKAWQERRADINSGAAGLTDHVSKRLSASKPAVELSSQPVLELGKQVSDIIDPTYGGISGAPKFPNAPYMTTLWLSSLESQNETDLLKVIDSFEKMLLGGIYDHVGGGLCRYSTDDKWIVPHFEKMLYDNAQLIELCVYAHGASGGSSFRERIDEVVNWLECEMTTNAGSYASSLDADSEGEEGKFYLWTENQIRDALDKKAEDFLNTYELKSPASWEGDPIIARTSFIPNTPEDLLLSLLRQRETRVRPGRDDKSLTDWNGMAIHAIALAARHFDHGKWAKIAIRLFEAITNSQDVEAKLPHSVNGGSKLFPAISSDYAAMINAAVSLFELTGESSYVDNAKKWAAILTKEYGDGEGGHYLTSQRATDVPIRIRGDIDEATPSSTAQIVKALSRLATASGDPELSAQAYDCASLALGRATQLSHGQSGIFNSAYLTHRSSKLVIIEDEKSEKFSFVARALTDPRRTDIIIKPGEQMTTDITLSEAGFVTSEPGAWLCRQQTCLPPIKTARELEVVLLKETMRL